MTGLWGHPGILRVGEPGAELLLAEAKPVSYVWGKRIGKRLLRLMAEHDADSGERDMAGGLAAPQIGEPYRVVAVRLSTGTVAMLNPEIVSQTEVKGDELERCFSLPGYETEVSRPLGCTVAYVTMRGNRTRRRLPHRDARLVLHEVDHLDGVLINDTRHRPPVTNPAPPLSQLRA